MADINECAECSAKTEQPLVGILMGSNSDWEVMKNAAQMLKDFGVPFEARVVSAHRMPDEMFDYAEKAAERGIRVIIAGAGGAAHLPGMLAAKCTLPVCGVPVPSKYLRGVDSLHSIVQMPKGVPVATFAIGEALRCADSGAQQSRTVEPSRRFPRRAECKSPRHDAPRRRTRLRRCDE